MNKKYNKGINDSGEYVVLLGKSQLSAGSIIGLLTDYEKAIQDHLKAMEAQAKEIERLKLNISKFPSICRENGGVLNIEKVMKELTK